MLPCNKIGNLRRRVARAERFPHNTCPASRHLRMIADELRRGDCPQLREDPEHCAATMLSVLESLWKLRTKTKKPNVARFSLGWPGRTHDKAFINNHPSIEATSHRTASGQP